MKVIIADGQSRLVELPFGGREKELKSLEGLFDNAAKGQGSLAFIAGEAGVGKTRLAQEFLREAKKKGASTLYARCLSRSSSLLPYSAWVEIVRQFASEATVLSFIEICGNASELMFRLLPEMASLAMTQRASIGTGLAQSQQHQSLYEISGASPMKYFDAVSQFLFRLSERRTLTLVLDDFQWCDQSSLDLLQYISTHGLENHSLLILCLYRDTQLRAVNPSLVRTVSGNLRGQSQKAALRLERLNRATAVELLRSPSTSLRLSERVCDLVYRKTGGNPLFMNETLALLAQQGALTAGSSYYDAPEVLHIQVPDSVKEVVRQRIAPLDPKVREVLKVAALIGETFDPPILRRMVSESDEGLSDSLRAAEGSGLVFATSRKGGEAPYAFADEVVVEVLTEHLGKEFLRDSHLRIAKIKEEFYGERKDERAAELAEHFEEAGDPEKSLEYSLKAGDAARRVNANKEARVHYERALASLERLAEQGSKLTRGTVLEKLGDTYWMGGDAARAYAEWKGSVGIYEALGDNEKAGSLRRKMGWYYSLSFCEPEKATKEYRLALQHLLKVSRGPGLGTLYHHLGEHYWFEGEHELARENYGKAIEIAREFHLVDLDVTTSLLLAFITPIEDRETVLGCLHKSDLVRPEHVLSSSYYGSPEDFVVSHLLTHSGIIATELSGDWKAAQQNLSLGFEIAKKSGSPQFIIWVSTWLAEWGYIPSGEWRQARQALGDAQDWSPLENFPVVKAEVFDVLGGFSLFEGDLEKAETYLKVALDCSPRFGAYSYWDAIGATRTRLGRLYIMRGDYTSAERCLKKAHNVIGGRSRLVCGALRFAECLFLLVQLYSKLGKKVESDRYLGELRELTGFAKTDWARAYCDWATGLVASLYGNVEEATRAFEEAVDGWTRLGWSYELGSVYRYLAKAQLEVGEVELSCGSLDKASEIFNRLGAARDAEEALALRASVANQGASKVFKLLREGNDRSKRIFEYLVGAFMEDYFARRLSPDSSGWRSLVEIAKQTKTSHAGFYRATAKESEGLRELLRLGLVEEREFLHQRGRGGTATRIRAAYGTDDVRGYVTRRGESRGLIQRTA